MASDATKGGAGGGEKGTPLVQIGHYVLGETLGVGTFGKVKGKDDTTILEVCGMSLMS